MAARLVFDAELVRKLADHSRGREHPDSLYGEPLPFKEYLYLVHDHGVYLMSGAKDNLPNPAHEANPRASKSLVAYAQGCDPDRDEDAWDNSRDLVGGDDFGEPIGLDAFNAVLDAKPAKIAVTLGTRTIKVAAIGHRKTP